MKDRECERLKYKCNALIEKVIQLDTESRELDAKIVYLEDRKRFLKEKKEQKLFPQKVPERLETDYIEPEENIGTTDLICVELIEDYGETNQDVRIVESARNECIPISAYSISNNEVYKIVGQLSSQVKEYEQEEIIIRHVSAATVSFGDIISIFIKILGFLFLLAVVVGAVLLLVSGEVRSIVLQFFTNNFIT